LGAILRLSLVFLALAGASAQAEPAGSRPMPPAKNYASTRFIELAEINTDNVPRLGVAFTFSTGIERGHEAVPVVADGTMYIVTPFPNYVYAFA
jgi:glucose dehydrogenase